jgi:hypothetical protein
MRVILFLFAFLGSLTSLANITLELAVEDYKITATLTPSDINSTMGTVEAQSQINGICRGAFNFNIVESLLTVTFEGTSGCGSNCNNESASIRVSLEQYHRLIDGYTLDLEFCSNYFLRAWKWAKVKIVSST